MKQQSFNQTLGILPMAKQGKVRDIYNLGENLLMVATDRISAFDIIMNELIPGKGVCLTQISNMWFKTMEPIVSNHLQEIDPNFFPRRCLPYKDILDGRAVLVKKIRPLPVECIVRGYISGSGWKSYQQNGTVCGIELPSGLKESEQLPMPLFTPSTKAAGGEHDINISFDEMANIVGGERAEQLRCLSMRIYQEGARIAEDNGVIIADTKFEFGEDESGNLILIDEILTPDSSRFWPMDQYQPGKPQPSFDKQYLRDYLVSLDWNGNPPPPPLPQEVIDTTREKYDHISQVLTGSD